MDRERVEDESTFTRLTAGLVKALAVEVGGW